MRWTWSKATDTLGFSHAIRASSTCHPPIVKLAIAAVLGATGVAGASPLSDAIANKDVTGLRAKLDDASARCALGVVYAKKNDLPRADLYLYGCDDVQDADI